MKPSNFFNRLFLVLCFVLSTGLQAQSLPTGDPGALGFSPDRLSRLDAAFDRYVEAGELPGGVILVARKDQVAYYRAFGYADLEARKPMPREALFRIASQSKAIVSVGILLLQEEGKLLIQDRLSKYIPEFAETTVAVSDDAGYREEPAKRPITLRDLLTHTAGIGYGWGPAQEKWEAAGIMGWYFADRDEPILETVRRMAALPNSAHPGEQFVYGYNTDILGAVIEVVSGQPLDVFLKERIFGPLGMEDTFFYVPREKAPRLATVYTPADGGGLERAPDGPGMNTQGNYVNGPRKSFSGGAGLVSTAADYYRFLQMMENGGTLGGVRLLSPRTVELMTVNHLGEEVDFGPGRGFGLGFEVVTDMGRNGTYGSVGQYGWGGAYHSTYWVDPREELIVVYFTQVRPNTRVPDHGLLGNLVYQALVD
ncbi:serine hydrolase [Robiginitalea sp. SC105]|uniref:serine hydrolase domain-containing protein n=1 Tax=Robiginitalea sp. SC105 TaxID=2762332 RepID=UPI00163A4A45|nr:serine hydrolase domain-containing protein [Robiginitalea sp. SC105]MBC2839330.1 beta-lactamase family protein [Robiginitalea sp. SC105]